MALSSIIVGVAALAVVALFITQMVLEQARPAFTKTLNPTVGNLGVKTKVGTMNDVRDGFLASSGGTFHTYVFAALKTRTEQIGNNQEPILLFQMGNSVQFQILPGGASAPPTARLAVLTQGPQGVEYISVPPLPMQDWVHLAIVREGRRFTVYQNGSVVASDRTQQVPVVNSSQLYLGDDRLRGEFVAAKIAPTPYRLEEIRTEMAETSNTRNVPRKPFEWSWPSIFSCPNGLFCQSTGAPPSENPLKMWQTPQA